jgi:hypothetical protein
MPCVTAGAYLVVLHQQLVHGRKGRGHRRIPGLHVAPQKLHPGQVRAALQVGALLPRLAPDVRPRLVQRVCAVAGGKRGIEVLDVGPPRVAVGVQELLVQRNVAPPPPGLRIQLRQRLLNKAT